MNTVVIFYYKNGPEITVELRGKEDDPNKALSMAEYWLKDKNYHDYSIQTTIDLNFE